MNIRRPLKLFIVNLEIFDKLSFGIIIELLFLSTSVAPVKTCMYTVLNIVDISKYPNLSNI